MNAKVPDTQLYTVWVDFQSGSIHIYNVECLTFDKQQAEQYMAVVLRIFLNANMKCGCLMLVE